MRIELTYALFLFTTGGDDRRFETRAENTPSLLQPPAARFVWRFPALPAFLAALTHLWGQLDRLGGFTLDRSGGFLTDPTLPSAH